jgi:branched-chain amino acid transport system substrate-binding protein
VPDSVPTPSVREPRRVSRRRVLGLGLAAGTTAACRGGRDSEVVIGVLAARTGARAPWGEDLFRGIELGAEQQNVRGGLLGRRVRIVVLDTASRDDQAGALAGRLADRERAYAVLGELSSASSERAAAATARHGVPFIAPASTARDVSRVNDFAFRTALRDGEQAAALARYARQLQRRRAAIVSRRSSALHMAIATEFRQAFRASAGEVVLQEMFGNEDTEMVQLAARVRASGADVLFVPAYASDAARVAVAARHGRVNAQLMGTDGWSSPELRRFANEAVIGALISEAFSPSSSRPEVEQFVQAFQRRYHATPGTFAAHGYDAVRWVLHVASRVPSLESRALRESLAGSRLEDGVIGPLAIDTRRVLTRPANIYRVERTDLAFVAAVAP